MNISSSIEIEKFKFDVDITDYLKFSNDVSVKSERYFEIQDWLSENVGFDNFRMGFRDLGQDGYWSLALNNEEDWILFKIKFSKLGMI
jgi:hypothetical protein